MLFYFCLKEFDFKAPYSNFEICSMSYKNSKQFRKQDSSSGVGGNFMDPAENKFPLDDIKYGFVCFFYELIGFFV